MKSAALTLTVLLLLLVAGASLASALGGGSSTACNSTTVQGTTVVNVFDGITNSVVKPDTPVTVCATATADTVTLPGTTVTAPGTTVTVTNSTSSSTSSTTSTTVPTTSTTPTTTTVPTTTAPSGQTIAPGQSWQTAYNTAACGSTVTVLAGNQGAPSIGGNRCVGSPITFTGQPGVNISGKLTITAANLNLEHLIGHSFDILCGATNIDIGYSDFGNVTNSQPQIQAFGCLNQQPKNITIHDSALHDFNITDPSVHNECLQVLHGQNIQILRNRIYNCAGTGALGLTCESQTLGPILVENNMVYGVPNVGPNYGAQISGDCRNLTVRNNSSTLDWFFADTVTGKGYKFTGNYMPLGNNWLCGGPNHNNGAVFSHNVFRGGTCGASDLNVSALQFVSSTDLHLLAGANAIDKADPLDFPATDIDGQIRPFGLAPDAGAHEKG